MYFWVFSLGQGTEWEFFGTVAKIKNIFWVMPAIPDFLFFGEQGMLGPSLHIKKN